MTTPFGLIIQCDLGSFHDFEMAAEAVNAQKIKWIWIKGNDSEITPHLEAVNDLIQKEKLKVFCESTTLIQSGLIAEAIIIDDFKEITELKKDHPTLLIGGVANDLARSKNFELFEGDFVFLGPVDEIGENPYITLIPEKPDYEWRFIDITIPVIGFGMIEPKKLESFCKIVNLSGFACTIAEAQKHSHSNLRFPTL
ncbi:MAG: hypothetical protein AB8B72_13125 [Crocinitomicaceae bacterium]